MRAIASAIAVFCIIVSEPAGTEQTYVGIEISLENLCSDGDRDFHHTIPLAGEEIIGFFDVIKFEPVRNERFQVDTPCCNYVHELPHPFFATGASSTDYFKPTNSFSE